jgi:hypothetical protein
MGNLAELEVRAMELPRPVRCQVEFRNEGVCVPRDSTLERSGNRNERTCWTNTLLRVT